MPSARVTANTTAQELVSLPPIKKAVITSIEIENGHTAGVSVTLDCQYTPAGGSQTTKTLKTLVAVTAGERLLISYEKPSIEFIGKLRATASAVSAACEIVVGFEYR